MWSAFNGNLPEIFVHTAVLGNATFESTKTSKNPLFSDGCTVCLRAAPSTVQKSDVAALQSIMQRLSKSNCICILNHEEESGTSALYIHSARPLKQVLDMHTLSLVDIQPQKVWLFKVSPPYNADRIQDVVSYYCSSQNGVNAGYMNGELDTLTLFEDKDAVKSKLCTYATFNVSLCFQKDVCPFGDVPLTDPDDPVLCVQGPSNSTSELEDVKAALLQRHEPSLKAVWVDPSGGILYVLPHPKERLLDVRRLLLTTLEELGLPLTTKGNHLVLYQRESPVMGCAAEIRIGLLPDSKSSPPVVDPLGGFDLITKLFWELGYTGKLQCRPAPVAINLVGCKCLQCGQTILQALIDKAGLQGEVLALHLNLSRHVLLVTPAEGQETRCIGHVLDVLRELGIQSSIMFTDPLDMDHSDALQAEGEIENYLRTLRPSNKAVRPSPGRTEVLEVGLLPGAVKCYSCSNLLQSTLRVIVPGLRNLAINVKTAELMVEYELDHVTESEIMTRLGSMGYQPWVISRGKHLQPKLYEDLMAPCEELLPTSLNSPLDFSPHAGTAKGRFITQSPARLVMPSALGRITKDVVLLVYGFAPEIVPLHSVLQTGEGETMRLFVQTDLQNEEMTPVEDPLLDDAELEHPFTLWYDKLTDRKTDQTMTALHTFYTLQQFWRIWMSIDLAKLQPRDLLLLFRAAVPPELTHPANVDGGRWYTRALPQEMRSQLWIGMVLAVVGQTLQGNTCDEVCGVVLSVKPGGDRIEVWVDGGHHHQLEYGHERAPLYRQLSSTIGDLLCRVLQPFVGPQRLHFWTHEAYERHRRLHSGSARRDKRKQYARQTSAVEAPAVGPGPGGWEMAAS